MVKIYKNPNGDTRTAPRDISFEKFQEANNMHIKDVRNVMDKLGQNLSNIGTSHDYTKLTYDKLFYENLVSTINDGTDFVNGEWYQLHIAKERHHLLSNCPEDVNLLDILEMITDCVCAGMSRSGEVRPMEISDDILRRAMDNTVEKIKSMIIIN